MVAQLTHLTKAAARVKADELLERFKLTEAGDRPAKTYSGGMKRRVGIAQALLNLVMERLEILQRKDQMRQISWGKLLVIMAMLVLLDLLLQLAHGKRLLEVLAMVLAH